MRLIGRVVLRASDVVPRPSRVGRGSRRLDLGLALTASDLSPGYLDSWPLARKAWHELIGIDALLVLVARPGDVPEHLATDPSVHVFEPIAGLHTAFQAQCVRLLYPALLDVEGGVITSDVDMVPLSADYFHGPAAHVRAEDFVAYRDVLVAIRQIPICYNGALPRTWAELFDIESLDDIRARLNDWGGRVSYDGVRGGRGWDTDQERLYDRLLGWALQTRRAWILDDRATGFRRLERAELQKHARLETAQARRITRGGYTDYHALPPTDAYAALNEQIVALALAGRSTRT